MIPGTRLTRVRLMLLNLVKGTKAQQPGARVILKQLGIAHIAPQRVHRLVAGAGNHNPRPKAEDSTRNNPI
jgi:hypothetical protein